MPTATTKKKKAPEQHKTEIACPICKASMILVHMSQEEEVLYKWYQCSGYSCDGQWLEKSKMTR